jgi:hypothetical protein
MKVLLDSNVVIHREAGRHFAETCRAIVQYLPQYRV